MSHNFNKAAHVYICTVDDVIAGFCAVMAFPHPKIKNIWKEHRVVVLPDYQGVGIGSKMTDCIAQMYKEKGCQYVCVTSAPAFIHARSKSKKWIVARKPSRLIQGKTYTIKSMSDSRITVSFKYRG